MRQNKGFSLAAVILILVGLGLITLVAIRVINANGSDSSQSRQDTAAEDNTDEHPLSGLKGVSLSPKSYEPADYMAFFEEAGKHNDIVSWAGPWTDIDPDNSPPATVAELAGSNGYLPMIITSTHSESGGSLGPIEPMNQANKQRFADRLAKFAEAHKPPFIGIGNEINRIYDHDRQQYQRLVEWFEAAVAAIKRVSPDSQVFTIFQYENLNGLHGGLFGGSNDRSDTDWQLLGDFGSADFIAFTTYPYLTHQTPADIPDNYYARINVHTDKPAAFTEVGWPSADTAEGWPSSPQEQAAFLRRFDNLTNQLDIKFATWPFLYEQDFGVPFNNIGLINSGGQAKPAYGVWKNLRL